MRLLLTALRCEKGDLAGNLARHRDLIAAGAAAAVDLVLLPEMSLTGYDPAAAVPLGHPCVTEVIRMSAGAPAVCFGLVESGAVESGGDERPLITQLVAAGGSVVHVHRKAGIAPDERAAFRAGAGSGAFAFGGASLSLAVCAEIGLASSYGTGSKLILGPAAPGLYGPRRTSADDWRRGFDWWRGSVLADARQHLRTGSWLAVSTQAGATADEDFPGWCGLVAPGGEILAELPDRHEGSLLVDAPTDR